MKKDKPAGDQNHEQWSKLRSGPEPLDDLPDKVDLSSFDGLYRFQLAEHFVRLVEPLADEEGLHDFTECITEPCGLRGASLHLRRHGGSRFCGGERPQ